MTKKMSPEELAERKAARIAAKHAVPHGHDMAREIAAATMAAHTEAKATVARKRKAKTTTLATPEGKKLEIPSSAHDESPAKAGYDLTGLPAILSFEHGREVSGRFGMALNFVVQSYTRALLKEHMAEQAKTPQQRKAEAEINEYYGFDAPQAAEDGTARPEITLDDAMHWQTVTWLYVRDLSKYTEADDKGVKRSPYAWMASRVKNPFEMVYSDGAFGQTRQVASQTVNAALLGFSPEQLAAVQDAYDESTTAQTEARIEEKQAVLRGFMRDRLVYRTMSSEVMYHEIALCIEALGISVPKFMAEVAASYKDNKRENALAGKYIGDIDPMVLAFVPEHKFTQIGTSHAEKVEAARRKHEAAKHLFDDGIAADKATKTPEAQAELKSRIRRVTQEQATRLGAVGAALKQAVRH